MIGNRSFNFITKREQTMFDAFLKELYRVADLEDKKTIFDFGR